MADITAEAIAKIEALTRQPFEQALEVSDRIIYLPDGYKAIRADTFREEPEPPSLKLATLTGLRDYLHANRDGIALNTLMVQVESPTVVVAFGPLHGPVHQRDELVKVSCNSLVGGPAFEFGKFYDLESFNIALQSLFVDSPDRARVLSVVGSVRAEGVRTTDDNGITQTVTAKLGVVLNQQVDVPNPVWLAPFRTFREIEQPVSPFVLRMQSGRTEGSLPTAALFEADGGNWKLTACQAIAAWLRANVVNVPELGVGITVLA